MLILLAEDNHLSARLLGTILENNGYRTLHATDGMEALKLLEQRPEIRLLISDVNMPNCDGIELVQRIREDAAWHSLPIIMVSSVTEGDKIRGARLRGVKHYLTKPVDAQLIVNTVKRVCREDRVVLADAEQMMSRLGLDASSWFDLLTEFTLNVVAFLDSIDTIKPNAETLTGLYENSFAIGAERFADAIYEWYVAREVHDENGEIDARSLVRREGSLLREVLMGNRAVTTRISQRTGGPASSNKENSKSEIRSGRDDTKQSGPPGRDAPPDTTST